jgi:hypothetical protein
MLTTKAVQLFNRQNFDVAMYRDINGVEILAVVDPGNRIYTNGGYVGYVRHTEVSHLSRWLLEKRMKEWFSLHPA